MAKVTLMKREPTHLQIAHRAFEIYVSRGGHHGHDVGDWFESRTPAPDRASAEEAGSQADPDESVAADYRQQRWLAIQASFHQRLPRRPRHPFESRLAKCFVLETAASATPDC